MSMQIFHFEKLNSTQDKVFELIESGSTAPFIVIADQQTHGRGRLQREWISERGRSLTMSVALVLPVRKLSGLSLMIGLAARDAISSSELLLKWPNDLMLNSQKVGGILIESRSLGENAAVSIGIGINLLPLQTAPYQGIGQSIDAEKIGNAIERRLEKFLKDGFSVFQSEYESVLWRLGERVTLQIDQIKTDVKILGVNEYGWLKTEANGELYMTDQGEILFAERKIF